MSNTSYSTNNKNTSFLSVHNDSLNTGSNAQDEKEIYDYFTYAALEDKLLNSFLSSRKNGRFYYAQADYFLNRINVYSPLPIFMLHDEDIPEALGQEIKNLGEKTSDELVTNVVRRIYEAIDSEYYHTNGIYGKVKWFIMEGGKKEAAQSQ